MKSGMLPEELSIQLNNMILLAIQGQMSQTKIAYGLSENEAHFVRVIIVPDNFKTLEEQKECSGHQD